MSKKHSLDDLPESPAKKGLTVKDILEAKEQSSEAAQDSYCFHIYALLTLPLVELYFFEKDEENDAYHVNINDKIKQKDQYLLLKLGLVSVGTLKVQAGNAPMSAFRQELLNSMSSKTDRYGNAVHYKRQVAVRMISKQSTSTSRKRIATKIANWMNSCNKNRPPKNSHGKAWTPPRFEVPVNFDRTPTDTMGLLPLDYYLATDSVLDVLKITKRDQFNRNFFSENKRLAKYYFSSPYPEQAKAMLGYESEQEGDAAKTGRANSDSDSDLEKDSDLENDDDSDDEGAKS